MLFESLRRVFSYFTSGPRDSNRRPQGNPNHNTGNQKTMNANTSFTCPAHLQLEVSKAVYQLDFFARSIQLPGWPSPGSRLTAVGGIAWSPTATLAG